MAPMMTATLTNTRTQPMVAPVPAGSQIVISPVPANTTIRRRSLNILTGALMMDRHLRSAFLSLVPATRLAAIERHNSEYARHFGQLPVELNEEEAQFVTSVEFGSIQELYQALSEIYSKIPVPAIIRLGEGIYLGEETPAA